MLVVANPAGDADDIEVVIGADCNKEALRWAPPIRVRLRLSEMSSISC